MVKKPKHFHWHVFDRAANIYVNDGTEPRVFDSVNKAVLFLQERNTLISNEHIERDRDDYVVAQYRINRCTTDHAPVGGWVLVKVTQNDEGQIVHEVFGPYASAKAASDVMDLQPKHAAVYYVSTLRKL